jgi:hypothetical protein
MLKVDEPGNVGGEFVLPAPGQQATRLGAKWPNVVQGELCNVALAKPGVALDQTGADQNQVLDGINYLISEAQNAAETTAAGYASTAQANAEAASLAKASNLGDLASLPTALGNLGLTGVSGGGAWGGNWSVTIPVNIAGAVVDVIVQGGVVSTVGPDATSVLNFPVPFPNACWGVYPGSRISAWNSGSDAFAQLVGIPTKTQCTLGNQQVNNNPTIDIPWWAVGF